MLVGDIIEINKVLWEITGIDKTNKKDVWFNLKSTYSGYETRKNGSSVYSKSVKDPYYPEVYGRGYLGKYYLTEQNIKLPKRAWYGMMSRAYSAYSNSNFPQYLETEVSAEWFNFENFMAWWEQNALCPNFKYQVDKDLLTFGKDKVYSKETCILVSRSINSLLLRSEYKGYERNGKIEVSLGKKYLGKVETKQEALALHNRAKAEKLREILDRERHLYVDNTVKLLNEYITILGGDPW